MAFEKLIYGPYPWIDSGVKIENPLPIFERGESEIYLPHRTNSEGTFEAIKRSPQRRRTDGDRDADTSGMLG